MHTQVVDQSGNPSIEQSAHQLQVWTLSRWRIDTDGKASLNEFLSDVDDVDDVIPDEESHDTDDEETEVSHDPGSRSHDDITEEESQSEK